MISAALRLGGFLYRRSVRVDIWLRAMAIARNKIWMFIGALRCL
jgi:hypothetical protein